MPVTQEPRGLKFLNNLLSRALTFFALCLASSPFPNSEAGAAVSSPAVHVEVVARHLVAAQTIGLLAGFRIGGTPGLVGAVHFVVVDLSARSAATDWVRRRTMRGQPKDVVRGEFVAVNTMGLPPVGGTDALTPADVLPASNGL